MKSLKYIFLFSLLSCQLTISQELISDLFNGIHKEYLIKTEKDSLILYHKQINDRNSIAFGLELYYLKIPLKSIQINVMEVNKMGATDSIYNKLKHINSIVLLSGGFWGYDKLNKEMPLGLVVDNGIIKSKKINWKTGGVLFQKDGEIDILEINKVKKINFQDAIQSKPILVNNGENDIYSDSETYFDRICIGFTTSNELIVCGIFNDKGRGISLYEFAKILVKKEDKNHPNIKIALAMDGGPSSHLFFPTLGLHVGNSKLNFIPNIVEIKSSYNEN